jgi:hypothetical protein
MVLQAPESKSNQLLEYPSICRADTYIYACTNSYLVAHSSRAALRELREMECIVSLG